MQLYDIKCNMQKYFHVALLQLQSLGHKQVFLYNLTVLGGNKSIGFGDNTDLLWWNNANNQFCQLTTRVSYQRGIRWPLKCTGNHTYWGLKNNWGMQSKNGLCEGIPCSSFSVKELDVIVHKEYFPCITMLNFGHSVPHITSEPGGWGGN